MQDRPLRPHHAGTAGEVTTYGWVPSLHSLGAPGAVNTVQLHIASDSVTLKKSICAAAIQPERGSNDCESCAMCNMQLCCAIAYGSAGTRGALASGNKQA